MDVCHGRIHQTLKVHCVHSCAILVSSGDHDGDREEEEVLFFYFDESISWNSYEAWVQEMRGCVKRQ